MTHTFSHATQNSSWQSQLVTFSLNGDPTFSKSCISREDLSVCAWQPIHQSQLAITLAAKAPNFASTHSSREEASLQLQRCTKVLVGLEIRKQLHRSTLTCDVCFLIIFVLLLNASFLLIQCQLGHKAMPGPPGLDLYFVKELSQLMLWQQHPNIWRKHIGHRA